jgi:hypothetical protein
MPASKSPPTTIATVAALVALYRLDHMRGHA